jgi:glycerophosphoryl diester phosphodiesterase
MVKPGERTITTPPVEVGCRKQPPAHGEPFQVKFRIRMEAGQTVSHDEITVPVLFDAPEFTNLKLDDGVMVRNRAFGTGNGNGRADAGERMLVYEGDHKLRLYTNDPWVISGEEQLLDEQIPAIWEDGFTLSSVISIAKDCPDGHCIEFTGNYETNTYNPIERKVHWGKVKLNVHNPESDTMYFIAHRGESGSAPENTLAAFRLAWERNADAVELDIHLSKDNRIMVIHDGNTRRTSGKDFIVKDTDSDVLRTLDVGSFKDSIFRGEKIPFLEEAIDMIPSGKKLVIEIKSGADVLPWLGKLARGSEKAGQLVFIAFDWQVILEARNMFPDNPCYWLSSNKAEIIKKLGDAAAAGLTGLDLFHKVIDQDLMDRARALNLDIMAWTVDDQAEAKRLTELGVRALTTNQTGFLRTQIIE